MVLWISSLLKLAGPVVFDGLLKTDKDMFDNLFCGVPLGHDMHHLLFPQSEGFVARRRNFPLFFLGI